MQKNPVAGEFLSLLTAPVQELPASLVIILVAATLMLTTLSTLFWLERTQPSLKLRSEPAGLAN